MSEEGLVPVFAIGVERGPSHASLANTIALLFDRSNYRPEREEEEPATPAPRKRQERVLLTLVFALLLLAFVLPVSAAGLVDIVRYLSN